VFTLHEADGEWLASAPVRIERRIELAAPPDEVFKVLVDHGGWPRWFKGMRRSVVDGAAEGVGALRSVSVGLTRVRERFLVWHPDRRLTFAIVSASLPGLSAMVEDWVLEPAAGGSTLTITIGAEGAGPLRRAPWLVRLVVERSTRGASGLAKMFPAGTYAKGGD
jgi:uncharacterized protein YndB with AHSA1/START domain